MTAYGDPAAADIVTVLPDGVIYTDPIFPYPAFTDIVPTSGAGYSQ